MFGFGLGEMLVLLAIVVIVFGASRLPLIGRGLGEGIKNFRAATREAAQLEASSSTREPGSSHEGSSKSSSPNS
jgi:sec-independent protein translocase protein TatA